LFKAAMRIDRERSHHCLLLLFVGAR
jgi:hypothetical protein